MSVLTLDPLLYDPLSDRWRSLPAGLALQVWDADELGSDDQLAECTTTGGPLTIPLRSAGLLDAPDLYFLIATEGRGLDCGSWTLLPPGAPGSLSLPEGTWDSRIHGDAEIKLDQSGEDLGTAEFPVELRLASGVVAARVVVWDRLQGQHIPAPRGIPLEAHLRSTGARVGVGSVVKDGLGWVPLWSEERGEVVLSIPSDAAPLVIDLETRTLSTSACSAEQLVIVAWDSRVPSLGGDPPAALHPEADEDARRALPRRAHDLSGRPFHLGNEVQPLIDGEEAYLSMVQGILSAAESAYLVNWDYQPHVCVNRLSGEEPRSIQSVLEEAGADPHKRIRLLAWRFTTPFPSEERRQKALDALLDERSRAVPGFRGLRQRTVHPLRSHHQKALVVDGDRAWIGGLDFAFGRWATPEHTPYTHWQDADPLGTDGDFGWFPWHDVHCLVRGPAALEVETNLRIRWDSQSQDPLPASRQRAWVGTVPAFVARTWPAEEGGCLAEGVSERTIERLYLEEIHAARRSIYIEQQYLSHKGVAEALAGRVERARAEDDRDFRVVLVLPCRYYEPPVVNGQLAAGQKACLDRLAEADPHGEHILVLTVRTWSVGDGTFLPIYVHSKLMIVDERFCTVGSANTNARSMQHDTELNLVFEDPPTARAFLDRLLHEHGQGKLGGDSSFKELADGLRALAHANEALRARADQGLPLSEPPEQARVFPHVTENLPIPLPGPDWLF